MQLVDRDESVCVAVMIKYNYENNISPLRHERYLGMWVDSMKCGPGMVVSSSGTYCEATFANGAIAVSLSNKLP